jgi:DNA invertase Pin-like site-specific DNA recombinase
MADDNSTGKGPQDKPLRFGALIRVSTEKQEKRGESLRTQERQIQDAVAQLGGRITKRYAGQEHATAGWERQQLDSLLADAERPHKPFDAVMVAHPNRWSRDNVRSENGLEALVANGIRFFLLTQEQDLYDPTVRFYLAMSAVIGSYQAAQQTRTSLQNRIERAKRGWPASGKLPFGRTFDRVSGSWGVDPAKHAMIQDVAGRYLAGESMANLASEYGVNHPFLHKTLAQGCGTVWVQQFASAKLRIDETIPTAVPALLGPEIIAAVLRRAAANKTYCHGHLKHQYVFARVVFCGECGYAMCGQMSPHGQRYYRHQSRNGAAGCSLTFRPWVPAGLLEEKVLAELAEMWGNPKAVEKALADAQPNRAESDRARKRLESIETEQAKIKRGQDRIIGFIAKGTITEEQAEGQLTTLNEREVALAEESDRLQRQLSGILSPAVRGRLAEQVVAARRRAGSWQRDTMRSAEDPERMTYEQKRMLVEDVFGGTTPDGRRMGVYVTPIDAERNVKHRRWRYEIRGRAEWGGELSDATVTTYSRHCTGGGPPARRCAARPPRRGA